MSHQDCFAEVEQLAFAPSHLVPGIEPSPDKMLQVEISTVAIVPMCAVNVIKMKNKMIF